MNVRPTSINRSSLAQSGKPVKVTLKHPSPLPHALTNIWMVRQTNKVTDMIGVSAGKTDGSHNLAHSVQRFLSGCWNVHKGVATRPNGIFAAKPLIQRQCLPFRGAFWQVGAKEASAECELCRAGAVFGGFPVPGGGVGPKGAVLGEMGRFAGVLAGNGPVKMEKTGVETNKTGVKAIFLGKTAAATGVKTAATGVGAALTPVGAAATGVGGAATGVGASATGVGGAPTGVASAGLAKITAATGQKMVSTGVKMVLTGGRGGARGAKNVHFGTCARGRGE